MPETNGSASVHHSYSIRILAVCTFSHAVQFFSEKKVHVQLARHRASCAKLGLRRVSFRGGGHSPHLENSKFQF